jgi:tRNA/rRNA methyltransferase
VILSAPQLAENIGGVARVMANFGLHDLRLVNPRDGWPQERAWASASGADWPLDGARVFGRLEDALSDLQLVYAATARPREVNLPVLTPREAAASLSAGAGEGLTTGLLFGAERAGLESDEVSLCSAIVTVPIDPRFRSLNLAQAVAVNAYEWRLTQAAEAPAAFRPPASPPAGQDSLHGLFQHLERELDASGFFHPPEKTPGMVRNLRAILARAALTEQEVSTLRGVVTALSRGRGRVLEKLARRRTESGG